MKDKKISKEEVLELSSKDEDHFYDKKSINISGKKTQKIAVAFANADGGDILLGIKDKDDEPKIEQRWEKVPDKEEFNHIFQALTEVEPSLDYEATFLLFEESYGLRITVEKSDKVHKTSASKVYVRKSAQSLPIKDPERIRELSYAKGESTYEDNVVSAAEPEAIFESEEVAKFLDDYSPKTDPIDFTINQNLVDRKTYSPRVCGILLFNQNPSTLIPKKCAVKISRYVTREDDPDREHLKEQYNVEGPLYDLIQDSVDKVKEIIEKISIWHEGEMKKAEYPHETLWEIIVNALIHRDYSMSDDTHILIYDDRINVISPGKLPGYVNVENILDARYARNPKIVRTLNRYKNAPNKDMGEGLNTAFQKMEEFKLQPPEISVEGNNVKVTIPHTPLAAPEEIVLNFLKKKDTISNSEAREVTGIKSENTMKNVFYRLRDAGKLERVPGLKGRSSRWQKT